MTVITGVVMGFLVLIIGVMGYIIHNQERKIDVYEETIAKYYNNTTNILRTVRELDSMQMFEKDDEVGSLFQQLITIIGDLRMVVYEDVYVNKQGATE